MEDFDKRYMIGTEGNIDYLVVAEHKELSIGLKPIVAQQNEYQIFIGFRVRCHENVENPELNVGDYLEEHPCLFTWEKVDAERASSMFGALFPIPYGRDSDAVIEKMEESGFYQQMIDQLSGMFSISLSPGHISEFIKPRFDEGFIRVGQIFGDQPVPENFDQIIKSLTQSKKPGDKE